MKRNIILSVVLILSAIAASAAPITSTQAAKNLRNFLYGSSDMKFSRGPITMVTPDEGIQPYYIFNIGNDGGFVILSGDDAACPVLGYSYKGHFDVNNVPVNMQSWLDGYASSIKELQKRNLPKTVHRVYELEYWEKIPQLIKSEWNQLYPYNEFCPDFNDGNGHRPTGCVATAMAQVMYYHKWPADETAKIPEYKFIDEEFLGGDGSERIIEALEPTVFDWDSMTDTYDYYSSKKSQDAVAELMKYVGHSVRMMYGVNASGAYSENIAMSLITFFGYRNTARLLYRGNYNSQKEWEKIMYDELAEGRPILYSGVTKKEEGHQFVCDGYEKGYFHINWGWGGQSDGYFKLEILDPLNQGTGGAGSGMAFSEAQSAVIGVQKPLANDCMKVGSFSANIGETGYFNIALNNSRKNNIALQFDLKLPEGVSIPNDGEGTPRVSLIRTRFEKNSHKVDVNRLADGNYRFIIYSPSNSLIKGTRGSILNVIVKLSASMTKGVYPAQISNVVLCNNKFQSIDIKGCDFNIEAQGETLLLGDADKNGKVEQADVDAIVGSIMYENPASFDFKLADVDADGMLDVSDVMQTLDIILSNNGSDRNIVATETDKNDRLYLEFKDYALRLMFKNNTVCKALQFDVTIPAEININDVVASARISGFNVLFKQIATGKYRIIIFSSESANVKDSEGELAQVISDTDVTEAKISNVIAVTSDLRKLLLADTDYKLPTGIEEISADEDLTTQIYTLQGVRVDKDVNRLERGIYVINGKKIVIK